jgi:hypothetical protein
MRINSFLHIISFCLLPFICISQEIEWQNTIGGSNADHFRSIQQTTDGGYILGGYSISSISGDKTENSNGLMDYWIVKTDASGNIQWQNTIGGNNDEYLYSIHQTSDGGYILGGASNSNISGDKTENSMGSYDYWIVKTDASGIIQWQNTIGGFGNDYLFSIQQTADGGYILGGYSLSNISGDKIENSNGMNDYWIVKTDSAGIIQWQNTIGGSDNDVLYSINQTIDGGYILGGYSYSNISGDKTENSNGIFDYWIVKIDMSGNIQWQNTIGGNSGDALYYAHQTNDGGYILGGSSISNISSDKTENCIGGSDIWIVKTDTSGNIQWQNTIGGNLIDEIASIQQTTDGGYFLGGWSRSNISGDVRENCNGWSEYWIIKTDASGTIQWQNTIGGNDLDLLYSIQQTNDGGYILGGYSSSDISGDKTENGNGGYDYWLIKISDHYNLITGKLYIDSNSNSTHDTGEPAVMHNRVTEPGTGDFSFTGPNGDFSIAVLDSGNFSAVPAAINFYNHVPLMHTAYFSSIFQTDSLNDFAFQSTGVFNDVCASITPMGNFRSGFDASYLINYNNAGTTILSPTIIFFPDNDVSFVSATVTPTSVTTDSVVWALGPLSPFQSGSILVTVNVNVGTPIGTLINSGVRIEPLAGDANTICNSSYWEIFTTGSVDPNDILVDEDTLLTTQFPNPPLLEYIIRFQNTGNDTAFMVKVLNPIDTFNLQLNTFEFVASSHPVTINWIPWERNMEFEFENILLPDSTINEPASHGFIRYRIRPKSTLVAGDTIKNNVAIYFDFNQPVLTNTALTEIVLPTGIASTHSEAGITLAPNPAKDLVTVSFSSATKQDRMEIAVFDLFGRVVYQSTFNTPQSTFDIDVSEFSNGVYFIKIVSGDNNYCGKFVKQ